VEVFVDADVVDLVAGDFAVAAVGVAAAAEVVVAAEAVAAEAAVAEGEARTADVSNAGVAGVATVANPAEIVLGMPEQKHASQPQSPAGYGHQSDLYHGKPVADVLLEATGGTGSL
jgi:hypothetical protein